MSYINRFSNAEMSLSSWGKTFVDDTGFNLFIFYRRFFYRISLYSWPLNNMRVKDVNPYSGFSFLMLHRLLKIIPHFGWLSVWTKIFFSPMVIVYLGALNCPCLLYQIIFFYKSFLILSIICCFGNNVFLQLWFSYSILGWLIFSSAA